MKNNGLLPVLIVGTTLLLAACSTPNTKANNPQPSQGNTPSPVKTENAPPATDDSSEKDSSSLQPQSVLQILRSAVNVIH